jgi:hypothetical protein
MGFGTRRWRSAGMISEGFSASPSAPHLILSIATAQPVSGGAFVRVPDRHRATLGCGKLGVSRFADERSRQASRGSLGKGGAAERRGSAGLAARSARGGNYPAISGKYGARRSAE